MGVLEKEVATKIRKEKIQKAILKSVAVAGLLSVALLAPNALQIMEQFGYKRHKRSREVISNSRNRMLDLGFLTRDSKGFLKLTDKGEAKLRELELRDYKLPRPKKWDKKWRVLIFDIPEKRKGLREKVRRTLQSLGFERLQDSVWVFPYDCEDLITLLKADFHVGKDLLYLIVDKIENDKKFRDLFNLR